MARIIGGVATTHVPAIGKAIAEGLQKDPYWSPFFNGFNYVHQQIDRLFSGMNPRGRRDAGKLKDASLAVV